MSVAKQATAAGQQDGTTGEGEPRALRILRLREVERLTGLKRSRIYELEREGKFPVRVHISERATGWLEHEIQAYIALRVALRGSR